MASARRMFFILTSPPAAPSGSIRQFTRPRVKTSPEITESILSVPVRKEVSPAKKKFGSSVMALGMESPMYTLTASERLSSSRRSRRICAILALILSAMSFFCREAGSSSSPYSPGAAPGASFLDSVPGLAPGFMAFIAPTSVSLSCFVLMPVFMRRVIFEMYSLARAFSDGEPFTSMSMNRSMASVFSPSW